MHAEFNLKHIPKDLRQGPVVSKAFSLNGG